MARPNTLRQRRRYTMAEQSAPTSSQGAQRGDFIVESSKESLVQQWRPSWRGGPSTYRIFPGLNPDKLAEGVREFDPFRFSANQLNDFGDWLRTYPVVRNFGDPGVTFIMFDKADPQVDTQTLPAWVLYRAVSEAKRQAVAPPHWYPLLEGGAGRGPVLSKPTDMYFFQGAVIQHKGKMYPVPKGGAADDPVALIELPKSAGMALLEALNEPNPNFNGDPSDMANQFLHGDPVSLSPGGYVTFYNLEDGDPRVQQTQQLNAAFGQASQRLAPSTGGGQMQARGYGVVIEPTFRGMPGDLSQMGDMILNKVQPWDEILNIPSVEEQGRLIAERFPVDLVLYAFDQYPDWIPESVRKKAANQTVHAPGANQMQQAPAGQNAPGQWGGAGQAAPAAQPGHPGPPTLPPEPQNAPAAGGGFGQPAPSQTQQPQSPQTPQSQPQPSPQPPAGQQPTAWPTPQAASAANAGPAAGQQQLPEVAPWATGGNAAAPKPDAAAPQGSVPTPSPQQAAAAAPPSTAGFDAPPAPASQGQAQGQQPPSQTPPPAPQAPQQPAPQQQGQQQVQQLQGQQPGGAQGGPPPAQGSAQAGGRAMAAMAAMRQAAQSQPPQ